MFDQLGSSAASQTSWKENWKELTAKVVIPIAAVLLTVYALINHSVH